MPTPDPPQVLFGPFRLDRPNHQLYRGAMVIPCRPKSFAVLEYLVAHAGRLVTKEELLSAVWPDTAVTDTVLKVCIREIREALGDAIETPRFIETAHRLGYRFIGQTSRSNLPMSVSSLVGRQREIEDITRALEAHRLLTLVGAGGSGKSRLALEVGHRTGDRFDDGVWWVDLAPLDRDLFLPQAVASALGVRDQPGHEVLWLVERFVASRELLLIVDNCEHVIAAAAGLLQSLLRAAPRLRVLATSREALNADGECVWFTPPLSLPDPREAPAASHAIGYEAISLFVERAASALPSFVLSDLNCPHVVEIAHRLDGMPLAIELAAARVRTLPIEQMAGRLRESFRILSTERRGDVPRHRTLRAAIDWSYDLLPEPERRLLRRLSVFAGSLTTEAAECVAGEGMADGEVLDGISRLVDKSLLGVADRATGEAWRYRLLETVRQYAHEKLLLEEEDEAPRVLRRHAEYFLRLAEATEPRINTRDRQRSLDSLDRDIDNLRIAFERATSAGDRATAARLAGALFWFWFHRGRWREGRTFLGAALEHNAAVTADMADTADAASRARVLLGDGVLAWAEGDQSAASARLDACITLARAQRASDSTTIAHALHFLAMVRLAGGDAPAGRPLADEAVTLARTTHDPFCLTIALASQGVLRLALGDHDAARAALEESVEHGRRAGDAWAIALPLRNLGIIACRRGDFAAARAFLEDSLRGLRGLREKWFLSRSIETLAEVLAAEGDHVRAAHLFGAADGLRHAVGAPVLAFYRDDYERAIASSTQALGPAAFERSWQQGRLLTDDALIAYALGEARPT
jgi:predicted ATPase